MKSPYKTNWKLFKIWAIASLAIVFELILFSTNTPIIPRIVGIAFIYLLILGLGFLITIRASTIMNRKVDHPVALTELVEGATYWLNGQTQAQYLGQNGYTGRYLFKVWGVNNPKNDRDFCSMFPGEVRAFISASQEIIE